jgi:hypothetical protein
MPSLGQSISFLLIIMIDQKNFRDQKYLQNEQKLFIINKITKNETSFVFILV